MFGWRLGGRRGSGVGFALARTRMVFVQGPKRVWSEAGRPWRPETTRPNTMSEVVVLGTWLANMRAQAAVKVVAGIMPSDL